MRARLLLRLDIQQGTLTYTEQVRQQLADKDLAAWLKTGGSAIGIRAAEEDWLARTLAHWQAVGMSITHRG